jgi:Na+/melibiose symporter-like transporter
MIMKLTKVWLSGLIVLTVYGFLGFVALKFPNVPIIGPVVWSGTLTVLLISAIVACLAKNRAFWLGAVIFGLGYAVFASLERGTSGSLLTTQIMKQIVLWAYALPKPTIANPTVYEYIPQTNHSPNEIIFLSGFLQIGHALAAFVHAVVGGFVAVLIDRRLNPAKADDISGSDNQ